MYSDCNDALRTQLYQTRQPHKLAASDSAVEYNNRMATGELGNSAGDSLGKWLAASGRAVLLMALQPVPNLVLCDTLYLAQQAMRHLADLVPVAQFFLKPGE
jgi:hypothetical protein